MSVADLHDLELVWPSLAPTDVIVTGTFDQWSSSIRLVKGDNGFSGTVKVPWDEKVAYKFIVDGHWRCRDDRPQEDDGDGNINNVLRTPEKPLPLAHDPPARLFIPLEDPHSERYSDFETMVTAVEFLPPAEPATIKGSLPLPIPQITVEGLGQAPFAVTRSESKLNTAAATEGHVSPTLETPAKHPPFMQAPFTCDDSTLPVNDNGSLPLPSINGSGELPETTKEAVFVPSESAVSQPSHESLQPAQGTGEPTDRMDAPTAPTVLEPIAEPSQVAPTEGTEQAQNRQPTLPAFVDQTSPSTPASSTLAHKKRRSLFARIKHIFDRDNDKQVKKEKNKH